MVCGCCWSSLALVLPSGHGARAFVGFATWEAVQALQVVGCGMGSGKVRLCAGGGPRCHSVGPRCGWLGYWAFGGGRWSFPTTKNGINGGIGDT